MKNTPNIDSTPMQVGLIQSDRSRVVNLKNWPRSLRRARRTGKARTQTPAAPARNGAVCRPGQNGIGPREFFAVDAGMGSPASANTPAPMIGEEIRARVLRNTPTHYAAPRSNVEPYHRLLDFARANAGRTILDVGCATGGYAKALADAGFSVRATDINPEYVRLARERGVDAVLSDGKLPFADGAFDTVILFEVLEHVPDHAPLLREVRRVCRGNVLVTVPNCERVDELQTRGVMFEHFADMDHRHFFTADTLHALLEAHFPRVNVRRGDPLNPFGLCHGRWLRAIAGVAWRLRIVRPRFHFRLYAVAKV